jgi:hypothetical protein
MDIFKLLGAGGDEAIRGVVDLPALRVLAAAGIDLRPYFARLLNTTIDGAFTVEARMPIDLNPRY